METLELIGKFILALLFCAGVIIGFVAGLKKFIEAIKYLFSPVAKQKNKNKSHDEWLKRHDEKFKEHDEWLKGHDEWLKRHDEKLEKHDQCLDNDNKSIKNLTSSDVIIMKSLNALLSHIITGNGIDKLKKASEDLQNYLIERK